VNASDVSRTDLLDAPWPLFAAGLATALVSWLLLARFRDRLPGPAWILSTVGAVLAIAAFWCGFQVLGRIVTLASPWPLLLVAVLGGLAFEILARFYAFEKTLVSPFRGRLLFGLRAAALITLVLLLLEPAHSFLETREINREVAVLIDDSGSMQLSDQRLSPSEILDRAELFDAAPTRQRPPFQRAASRAEDLATAPRTEIEGLRAAPDPASGLQNRAERLPAFFDETGAAIEALPDLFESLDTASLPGENRTRLDDARNHIRQTAQPALVEARKALDREDAAALLDQWEKARSALDEASGILSAAAPRADEAFLDRLDEAERSLVGEIAARPRSGIARQVLDAPIEEGRIGRPTGSGNRVESGAGEGSTRESPAGASLLEQLGESYNLRLYRFARGIDEIASLDGLDEPAGEATPGRALTDIAGALEFVLDSSSPESLAGVLLLTDGRHNAASLPEDALRQLAVQNSPLCAVPVGGALGPVDISILSLAAPESIYLDDRIVARAEVKIDGLAREEIRAELIANGEVVAEQMIPVADANVRTEIRLAHTPEDKGILDYRLRLAPDEREIFSDNNEWEFKVAVTDDRTNVLLVDGFPRWEFRYLRNLFYGRDKSVHLQYVLLNPDRITRGERRPPVAASATRPFGEAEATRLPDGPEEWQLFDVIILGDIPGISLTSRDWRAIEEAVTQRGSLLVCVAGPRHMPHGIDRTTLQELLPAVYRPGEGGAFSSPEPAYRIELTATGKRHPVTSQSTSRTLNEEIWNDLPPLRWRYRPTALKETAEVLAYARPVGEADANALPADGSPDSVEEAIARLANQKERERDNALIVASRAGLGKVLLMNFDRTWRFRYGVGDTYHHRFWGQVTRWGAGENLRAGNDFVRLGTDRLTYAPGEPVTVTARVFDRERRPVVDAEIFATIQRDGENVARQRLRYREGSSGLYDGVVSGFPTEGDYRIVLEGESVVTALADNPGGPGAIETDIVVATARNPVERAELTADRDFLHRATGAANGHVAELWELDRLLGAFGAPKESLTERRNLTLWDKWPLLVAFLGLLTTEWVVRRRGGLV